MAKKNVFISMGNPFSASQEKFRDALMDFLREAGVEPRVISKTDFPTGNPLKDIARVIRECDGAIIVACERTYLETGAEKRQSPDEKPLKSLRFSTPWNQIEASMAYVLGLPILVLVEKGLQEEGLLEAKYDWYVLRVDIADATFNDKNVRGSLSAWCRKVTIENRRPTVDHIDKELAIRDFFSLMSMGTITILVGIGASLYLMGVGSSIAIELVRVFLIKIGFPLALPH